MGMTAASPWTVLDSRTLVRDRWINLRAETLRDGAGRELSPYYLLEYPDWVAAVVLTEDDRLVMVRQWRHGARAWTLELPAGIIDPGDADPVAAGRRETLEETGHEATAWRYLYAGYGNPAIQNNRLHLVLGTGARRVAATRPDAGEVLSVECVPVAEVLAGIGQSLIGQSMHVGAILFGLATAGRIRL
jgi:8-oxo-dGTP pyrophosphatase MutT (NUDIX family)